MAQVVHACCQHCTQYAACDESVHAATAAALVYLIQVSHLRHCTYLYFISAVFALYVYIAVSLGC